MPKCRECGGSFPPEDFRKVGEADETGHRRSVCKGCAGEEPEENVVEFPESENARLVQPHVEWNIDQDGFAVSLAQRGVEFSFRLRWDVLKRAVKGNLMKAVLGQ